MSTLRATQLPVSLVASVVGPIAIVEGRHPIIETREEMSFQSNDTYMAEASSFHIITGPNMAGKSTYLRQVLHTLPASVPAAGTGVQVHVKGFWLLKVSGMTKACLEGHKHRVRAGTGAGRGRCRGWGRYRAGAGAGAGLGQVQGQVQVRGLGQVQVQGWGQYRGRCRFGGWGRYRCRAGASTGAAAGEGQVQVQVQVGQV